MDRSGSHPDGCHFDVRFKLENITALERHHESGKAANSRGMQASMVGATVFFAVSRGVSMERITTETGLTTDDLIDPNGRLPDHLLASVWRLLDKTCPGQALTLEMASIAPSAYFGTLFHAMRQAADIRGAIGLFIRFQRIMSDRVCIELAEEPIETSVRFSHPSDKLDGGCGAEVGAALNARFMREHFSRDALVRVRFATPPHGPLEAYEDFFNVPVEFEKESNVLILKTTLLAQPVVKRDAYLLGHLEKHLNEVCDALASPRDSEFLTRIRQAIAENAQRAEYSVQGLSQQLNMSLRSLQREAKTHHLSLAQLVHEARMEHAKKLLMDSRSNIAEVSFLIGYSQVRAFTRAFKRSFGQTPSEFRRTSIHLGTSP